MKTPAELEDLRRRATEAAALSGAAQLTRSWDMLNKANDELISVIDELEAILDAD